MGEEISQAFTGQPAGQRAAGMTAHAVGDGKKGTPASGYGQYVVLILRSLTDMGADAVIHGDTAGVDIPFMFVVTHLSHSTMLFDCRACRHSLSRHP